MPYGTRRDVEYYGQFTSASFGQSSEGYAYAGMIRRAIQSADRAIDNYLDVPEGFFEGGGVQVFRELHDGVEVGYYGLYPSFGTSYKTRPKLRLKYVPVRSVVSVEEDISGTWTSRTEGRTSDFILTSEGDGIRYISNTPRNDYANVRVTYIAGYALTPGVVEDVSGRLAGAMIRKIIDAEQGNPSSVGGLAIQITATLGDMVFSPALKNLLKRLKHHTRVVIR